MTKRAPVMPMKFVLGIVVAGVLSASCVIAQEDSFSAQLFSKLLGESTLDYHPPEHFDLKRSEPFQGCNKTLRHKDDQLTLCLMIRPLARMEVDYSDPHSSAPNPNQVYPLLFESLKNQLSNHDSSPSMAYSPEQARDLFGADWAMATAFTLKKEQVRDHADAFLVGFHKHHKADVYMLFTYTDPEIAKDLINQSLSVLSFAIDN